MRSEDIIKRLRSDEDYYGDFGRKWLSNSDIYTLLNEPQNFNQPKETTVAMLLGRYFHTLVLEPDKMDQYEGMVVDASTRNTKVYKEAVDEDNPVKILKSEVENCHEMAKKIKSNYTFHRVITDPKNDYEVPGIIDLFGLPWKGKTDIKGPSELPDLKTTADIKRFKYSARTYNYDSQAYIYQQIFGLPVVFYVIDKTTHTLGRFECSPSFLDGGRRKVEQAVNLYLRYFAEGAEDDISNHFIYDVL